MRKRPPNENYHHNVPSSRGGTGQSCNLSPVRIQRHADFHDWAENKPPCALLRQMAIRSLGTKGGKSLPPDALKELLSILSPEDWPQVYEPATTVWTHGIPKIDRKHKQDVQRNTKKHLRKERSDVHWTIRSLLEGVPSPSEHDGEEDMLRQALLFFGTDLPHKAMQKLLTEKHAGELSWVKAMQKDVREELLSVLNGVEPTSLQSQDRRDIADTLKGHKQYLRYASLMENDR